MIDFKIFILAAWFFIHNLNPYKYYYGTTRYLKFFNPIWILFWILPFLIIPTKYREIVYIGTNYIFLLMIMKKLRYSLFSMSLIILSIGSVAFVLCGNIDILVLSGLLYPTPIGILLLLAKPQITLVLIAVIILRIYDKKGLVGVIINILPSLIAIVIWLSIFGFPKLEPVPEANVAMPTFIRIFVGLPLVIYALIKRSTKIGILATVFCVPYISINSYIAISLGSPILGFLLGWIKFFSLLLPS